MSTGEVKAVTPTRGGDRNSLDVVVLHDGIRRMLAAGPVSNNEVARALGCSSRTVARYRKTHDLPNFYGRKW